MYGMEYKLIYINIFYLYRLENHVANVSLKVEGNINC